MLFFRLAWREIRKRPGRALLTLFSIVIGVAAVVATSFTTQTTHRAFNEIFDTVAGKASLEVSGPVNTPFDEALLATVREVPGVETASPLIQRQMVIWVPQPDETQRRARLLAMGVDPDLDRAIHDYELVEGEWFKANGPGVMLNDTFAKNMGAQVGKNIDLVSKAQKGTIPATVIGLFKSRNTATTGQGGVMLMSLVAAQVTNKARKMLDTIQVVTAEGADVDAVEKEIAARLPEGVSVRRPAARSSLAEQTSLSTQQGLRMARAFALLVALFIIINTFLISVTQRRRQLGIMRAVGATRAQVAQLVYSEAILLGIGGTIIGCGVGYLAAQYLVNAMGSLYQTNLPPIQLTMTPFYLAAGFGIGVSLLGAALPSWKASRLSPLEAMREVLAVELEGVTRWLVAAGVVLVGSSVVVMVATLTGRIPPVGAIWNSILLLVGIVLLLPAALRPLSWLAAAVLRPWMRVEGRLARRELLRHRARTTLTTGVVFIAIATGIGLASSVIDNVQDVKNWYHKAIVADFFVRATAPDMATGLAADLPEEIDTDIKKIEGITSLESVRFVSATAAGQSVVLVVRDFDPSHEIELDLVNGEMAGLREKLDAGQVVIGVPLAQQAKLKVGDEIPLEVGDATKNFRVAAIANDYQAGGLTMYIERGVAQKLLGIEGVDAYLVKADHNRLNYVREELLKIVDTNGLLLQSYSDIQATIDRMMSGVVAGLWGLVVLGLVVAAFGVANTLMMTVLEQTRELGLLRILAMTRWQVRKSILAQALMMALLALIPGIAAGVGVAYLISWATLPVIGHAIPFTVHPDLLIGAALGGLVVVVAAAWVPAERAARLELPQALRYT